MEVNKNKLPDVLEWSVESALNDSLFNPDHFADYVLNNLKNNGEFNNLRHYNCLFRKGLRKMDLPSEAVICDIGSGAGYFSGRLSKYKFVQKIYAVEYSQALVNRVMPQTFDILNAKKSKIQRVRGSFFEIRLDPGSVDCVVANCVLHHSDDLKKTLREIYRILKSGGFLFALERAHPDDTSDSDIIRMLKSKKSNERMRMMWGINGQLVTREMLGEHEYRIKQWLQYFNRAGFGLLQFEWKASSLFSNNWSRNAQKLNEKFPRFLRATLFRTIPFLRPYRELSLFVLQKLSINGGASTQ